MHAWHRHGKAAPFPHVLQQLNVLHACCAVFLPAGSQPWDVPAEYTVRMLPLGLGFFLHGVIAWAPCMHGYWVMHIKRVKPALASHWA